MEVKELHDEVMQTLNEFKSNHTRELEEIKKNGSADVLSQLATDKANEAITKAEDKLQATIAKQADELAEMKQALARPSVGTDGHPVVGSAEAEYKSAVNSYLSTGRGEAELKSLEGKMMEEKQLSVGVQSEGGYLVTPEEGGIFQTRVFETSPMRQVASVQSISTDSLDIIYDDEEAAAEWISETGTRTESNTPGFAKGNIPTHEIYGYPKATQKILDDASINMEQWVLNKAADRIARKQNTAFIKGTGSGQPTGLLSQTAAEDGAYSRTKVKYIDSGVNGGIGTNFDKFFDLEGELKAAYRPNASWMTNRAIVTDLRKVKDSQGNYLWQPSNIAGQPATFAGYPIINAEDMPAKATGSMSLVFGDFREAYQIVDRIGIRTIRDNVTAPGFVKFNTFVRVGGDVINAEAVKILRLSA